MRKLTKITSVMMLVLMMTLTMFTTAFAADTIDDTSEGALNTVQQAWIDENIVLANDSGVTCKYSWMNTYLTTDDSKAAKNTESKADIVITSKDGTQIYLASGKSEKGLKQQIASNYNNDKTVENVSDITDGLNITADTGGAAAMMQGFAPIISLILGIVVTLVMVGMTIFSSFDVAYIAFPVFRNKCEDAKVQGTGAMVKKDSNGGASLRWVTDDAQYAVQQGSIESGKSPWGIYFKKRIMSYILLAIIVFILLTGNISLITNIALKVVSGIMNVLGGLA